MSCFRGDRCACFCFATGFHKVAQSGPAHANATYEFRHDKFVRGSLAAVADIKRRCGDTVPLAEADALRATVASLRSQLATTEQELRCAQDRIHAMTSQITALRRQVMDGGGGASDGGDGCESPAASDRRRWKRTRAAVSPAAATNGGVGARAGACAGGDGDAALLDVAPSFTVDDRWPLSPFADALASSSSGGVLPSCAHVVAVDADDAPSIFDDFLDWQLDGNGSGGDWRVGGGGAGACRSDADCATPPCLPTSSSTPACLTPSPPRAVAASASQRRAAGCDAVTTPTSSRAQDAHRNSTGPTVWCGSLPAVASSSSSPLPALSSSAAAAVAAATSGVPADKCVPMIANIIAAMVARTVDVSVFTAAAAAAACGCIGDPSQVQRMGASATAVPPPMATVPPSAAPTRCGPSPLSGDAAVQPTPFSSMEAQFAQVCMSKRLKGSSLWRRLRWEALTMCLHAHCMCVGACVCVPFNRSSWRRCYH